MVKNGRVNEAASLDSDKVGDVLVGSVVDVREWGISERINRTAWAR